MPFANGNKGKDVDSKLTLYQTLFDMTNTLCKIYPALTPFAVRRERAKDVFLLYRRIITQPKTQNGQRVDNKGRILVEAGDDFF